MKLLHKYNKPIDSCLYFLSNAVMFLIIFQIWFLSSFYIKSNSKTYHYLYELVLFYDFAQGLLNFLVKFQLGEVTFNSITLLSKIISVTETKIPFIFSMGHFQKQHILYITLVWFDLERMRLHTTCAIPVQYVGAICHEKMALFSSCLILF